MVIDNDFVSGLRQAIFNRVDHDDPVIVRAFLHSLIEKIIVDGSSITIHLKTEDISDQLPANCQVLVAGVVMRYLAIPLNEKLPTEAVAKGRQAYSIITALCGIKANKY